MIGELQDEQPFADLLKNLQNENTRVTELTLEEGDNMKEEVSTDDTETDPKGPADGALITVKDLVPTTCKDGGVAHLGPVVFGSLPPPDIRHHNEEHPNLTMNISVKERKLDDKGKQRRIGMPTNPNSPGDQDVRVTGQLASTPDVLTEDEEATNKKFVCQEVMVRKDNQTQPIGPDP